MGFNSLALTSVYGVYNIFDNITFNLIFPSNSCFPHIVNLACKAMINNVTGLVPEQDSIKNLRGVIQNVSVWVFINKVLLKGYIDSCIFWAT